jgi:glycosyltransferase involved in cell wall biosynthesis
MGIRGLPPQYGGFERHVDHISRCLSASCDNDVLVACEKKINDKTKTSDYHGVTLVYYPIIPGPRWLSETVFDARIFLSTLFMNDLDLIYYCGLSAGFLTFLPRLFGKKIVVNVDGFEWKNKKFNVILRCLLYINILCILIFANAVVTDNEYLQRYYKEHFFKDTILIPYSVEPQMGVCDDYDSTLLKYGLNYKGFFLTITRLEKMNSIEYMILETSKIYEKSGEIPLVIVGSLSTDHAKYIQEKYGSLKHIRLLGFISDLNELNILRKCAIIYIHGQVTGGTSPALLEALSSGMIIASFDSYSNRTTMKNTNYYFTYNYDFYLKNNRYQEYLESNIYQPEKSLSSLLLKIIDNYDKQEELQSENVALAESEYGIEKISRLHLSLYNRICKISTRQTR